MGKIYFQRTLLLSLLSLFPPCKEGEENWAVFFHLFISSLIYTAWLLRIQTAGNTSHNTLSIKAYRNNSYNSHRDRTQAIQTENSKSARCLFTVFPNVTKAICVLKLTLTKVIVLWIILRCKSGEQKHTPARMAGDRKTGNTQCWRGCGTIEHSSVVRGSPTILETCLCQLRATKMPPSTSPANAHTDLYPREMRVYAHENTCAGMFPVAYIPVGRRRKSHKCQSAVG